MYQSLNEAIAAANDTGVSLGEIALRAEVEPGLLDRATVEARLAQALAVMRRSIEQGLTGELHSVSGLVGGDAAKLVAGSGPMAGTLFNEVLAGALAVQEVNAAMGIIVAAPTAGGAGVLPGVLLALGKRVGASDQMLVDALAVAGLVGAVTAARASLSGAAGGCQAETGVGAAMAAAAGVELLGGTPTQAGHAAALTLQGTLGLVCDPLGGLVEVPCVYRNATGGAMALAGIEMALAGIEFPIPIDEVIDAMGEIGASMDVRYKETAGGGLAATPTG
ncbi:MAG: L-serine ammonia-lyase, iron-sulfur-dependent, subunit alpha, partial [Gemmatimonadales bacterium]